jgi:hypothetical protein
VDHTFDIKNPVAIARFAGVLYLIIIGLGLWSELAVRGAMVVTGDPSATAHNILAQQSLFRLSLAADTAMTLADVALAVALFVLLRPVHAVLALTAMVFRLVQATILGLNTLNQHAALLILGSAGSGTTFSETQRAYLAVHSLELHAHGYDVGLVFFGVNSLLTGLLVLWSGFFPKTIAALLMAAGAVYLTGSSLVLLAPGLVPGFAPAYAVPILAESLFCLWLLWRGVDRSRWIAGKSSRDVAT